MAGGSALALSMFVSTLTSLIDEKAAALAKPKVAEQLTPEVALVLEENPLTHGLVITTTFHRQNPIPGMFGPAIFKHALVQVVEGETFEEARANIGPSISESPGFMMVEDTRRVWIPPRHSDAGPRSW